MRLRHLSLHLSLIALVLVLSGCETVTRLADQLGVRVVLRGTIEFSGDVDVADADVSIQLYRILENTSAFDTRACQRAGQSLGQCYGGFNLDVLTPSDAVGGLTPQWDRASGAIAIPNVPADFGYVLVAQASASGAQCSSDIIGIEDESKLVTRGSLLSPARTLQSLQAREARFPRAVRLRCDRTSRPRTADVEPPPAPRPTPDPDPGQEPVEELPPELEEPEEVFWTSFRLLDKEGELLADASGASVPGAQERAPCGSSRPMTIEATLSGDGGGIERAFLHVQEGRGASAVIRDLPIPVRNGRIEGHVVQLSGGYARLQLDLEPIEQSSGEGVSHVIEICSGQAPPQFPAQELLAVLSWDTDGTDVDLHTWVSGPGVNEEHVYFAARNGRWAQLDVDDVDGFGPETITSSEDARNLTYDVKIHYWSDHGRPNPPTDATVRILYANRDAGIRCDTTRVVRNIRSRDWHVIGRFGPELAELAQEGPEAFRALGCLVVR